MFSHRRGPAPLSDTTRTPEPFGWITAVTVWTVALLLLSTIVLVERVAPGEIPGRPEPGGLTWLIGVVAVTTQAGLLVQRSIDRAAIAVLVTAVAPIAAATGLGAATGVTTIAVFAAVYGLVVGSQRPVPWRPLAAVASLVALAELFRQARDTGFVSTSILVAVVQGIGTVAVVVLVAVVVGSRRDAERARVEQERARAGEQAARIAVAVSRERTAMARELHDIAAHHVSGIAVMTAAIDRQIDIDPVGAKVAVREVREQSTAMLRDLRSLVTLLREDPDDRQNSSSIEPQRLGGVPEMVGQARRAGREVQLTLLGADDLGDIRISPLAQLSAYRTVQEALANAARHAPGAACDVEIDLRAADEVVLSIRNGPARQSGTPTPGGGFGLVGMRERAELTDARLTCGPTRDGGWGVTLVVPTVRGAETAS